jgi:hypothetical protein
MRSARYPPFIMCRTCRIVTTYEKRNVLSVMDGVEGAIHTTDYSRFKNAWRRFITHGEGTH